MTEPSGDTSSGRSRWLYGVLVASLALNLLILGGIASARFFHHRDHGLMGFVRKLPADRQGPVGETLRAERAKLAPLREAVRASWRESNAALGEEPFDQEKLKAALARYNEAESKMRTAISDALAETAGKLNPDERRLMREWRERKGQGFRRWRGRRDGGEE